MELQDFKVAWQKHKIISYSQEELNSIFKIKQDHSLFNFKTGLSWDLILALLLSIIFIVVLQLLNYKTSTFWSICIGILSLQHYIFYQIQLLLIRRVSTFNQDISRSLAMAINSLNKLLWFYRVWPATLAVILYAIFVVQFSLNWPAGKILIIGTAIAILIAGSSNFISAVMVRGQYKRLINLKDALDQLSEKEN